VEEEKKVLYKHGDGKTWVHSGDLGYIDEDGFLYLVGRIKRMIIRGGFKIYPSEIEQVISENKDVSECCVISIDSTEYGSEPQAHVVLKNNQVDENKIKKELMNLCREKLPSYAVPCDIIFDENFPLTAVGKIDYKKLEELEKEKSCKSKKG
ncbi:MAG: AMP-binding protein, partial [Lachnospiraceae bacterium]|nr:AMP-binding protein [Lachnospiraceae bacterium]